MKTAWPKGKVFVLFGILMVYIMMGVSLRLAVSAGLIEKAPLAIVELEGTDAIADSSPKSVAMSLQSAQSFFEKNMVNENGHVNLYISPGEKSLQDYNTNSEAVSYYLLWLAQSGNKAAFDKELEFMQSKMLHPKYGYLMWRLQENDTVVDDGSNIATDADLRAIKALIIAEKKWNDKKYTKLIDRIAAGVEKLGITQDVYLAPYAGVSGEDSVWKANEIWLSYADFTVFRELSQRRGQIWTTVYNNMKNAVLKGQIHNGLYNSMLTESRQYGNGIDSGGYSINSMWIMVRNAESGDKDLLASANKSLHFYRQKFAIDAELYSMYGSNGDAMSPSDTPWVYALVGRAAIALGDEEFSDKMIVKLIEHQITNPASSIYGSFPEGKGNYQRIGQFTLQESILTMQDYLKSKNQLSSANYKLALASSGQEPVNRNAAALHLN